MNESQLQNEAEKIFQDLSVRGLALREINGIANLFHALTVTKYYLENEETKAALRRELGY